MVFDKTWRFTGDALDSLRVIVVGDRPTWADPGELFVIEKEQKFGQLGILTYVPDLCEENVRLLLAQLNACSPNDIIFAGEMPWRPRLVC
jgi:hypothetical protein